MEIKLTTSEIRSILKGCQQTLRVVQSTREYRQIESSLYFSTTNDVYLSNAVSIPREVIDAIDEVEETTQQQTGNK